MKQSGIIFMKADDGNEPLTFKRDPPEIIKKLIGPHNELIIIFVYDTVLIF